MAVVSGILGLVGIQNDRSPSLSLCRVLKAAQLVIILVSCSIVLLNLDDISWEIAQEIIETDHPDIDPEMLREDVRALLLSEAVSSGVFWVFYLLYCLISIHSLLSFMKRGVNVDQQQLILTVPEVADGMDVSSARIQTDNYASTILHGQQAEIPVSIQ